MQRIVYTRHNDGGVDVMCPTEEIFKIMQSGGWWDGSPIGVRGFVDVQIERMVRDGVKEDAAANFARAVAFGGVVGNDAWRTIRDRDCGHKGFGFVRMDCDDLPDRWFRNAWRQNGNGNICIDIPEARKIQKDKITSAVNKARADIAGDVFTPRKMPKINHIELSRKIASATSADEIRRVWPEGLPCLQS